jgi:predicted TPR repeat methyltransferase
VTDKGNAALHDAYAAGYDAQVEAYDCHIADVLFGLCYEFVEPGQRLLDVGIGSGLSAQLFARAGLEIYGMDFSPAMLEACRAKGFAAGLKQHDLQAVPWPYASGSLDHLTCCGVFHFIPNLEGIFGEVGRVLVDGGMFAFTTRMPPAGEGCHGKYARESSADFEIFSHHQEYGESQLVAHAFTRRKTQRCYVGEELFIAWVAQR